MKAAERGNILFYILIAVVLLAALSYAVSLSGRGSISQVNDEKARLLATQILEYANTMANATAQLRLRGISDTNLCFDDTQWGGAGYNNPSCTDTAAKIYDLSGAGVTWGQPPGEAMDSAATPDNLWHIYGNNEVQEVGTTCGAAACSDLVLITDELKEAVCIKINDLLDIGTEGDPPPTDTAIGTTRFIGTYAYAQTLGDEDPILTGKTAACVRVTGTAKYTFYKVLVAR